VIILNLISSQCNLFEDPFFLSCSNESFLSHIASCQQQQQRFVSKSCLRSNSPVYDSAFQTDPSGFIAKNFGNEILTKKTEDAFIGRHFNCPPQVFYFDTFFNGQSYNDKITLFVFLFVCLSLLVFCLQGDYFCKKKLY